MSLFWKSQAERRCRKGELPEQVCEYLNLNRTQPLRSNMPVENVRFVVMDTEATGLNYKKDKLISIGAICLKNDIISIADSFETLIVQHETGDKESIPVHGILKRDLKQAAHEEGALLSFLDFLNNGIMVAHHADFDLNIINFSLNNLFNISLLNPVLDTLSFARRIEQGPFHDPYLKPGEFSLDALCERYNIDINDRHTSAGDAFLTARLLQVLLIKARQKGFKTLGDVLK